MGRPVGEGIKKCEEALRRIEQGVFNIPKHRAKKVTPAMVSKEAGLDAGFIKKNRELHQPLIDWINKLNGDQNTLEKRTSKPRSPSSKKDKDTIALLKERLNVAVSKELLMLDKIRELEAKLNKLSKTKHHSDIH